MRALVMTSLVLRRVRNCPAIIIIIIINSRMSKYYAVSCVGDKPVTFNLFPPDWPRWPESDQRTPPAQNVYNNKEVGVVSAAIFAHTYELSPWHVADPDDENFVICQSGMFTLLFQN